MPEDQPLYYRLDCQDRIIEIGGAWDRFAEENEGASVVADRIIGTSLFDHVTGTSSRAHIWKAVDCVRKVQTPRRVAYRCDSPSLKRYMEMVLKPRP